MSLRLLRSVFLVSVFFLQVIHCGAAKEPAGKKGGAGPAELLAIWNDYGLPLPPPEAPLVKFQTGVRRILSDEREVPYYSLGFLLEPIKENQKAVILSGGVRHGISAVERKLSRIESRGGELKKSMFSAELDVNGKSDTLLGTAIQCEARGWSGFARELQALALSQDAGHPRSPAYQKEGMDPEEVLYPVIWDYLRREGMRPGNDRAGNAAKMKRLLDEGHDLPRSRRGLFESLHAAAQPGKGKPGTPEAMIDRLVDAEEWPWKWRAGNGVKESDPYYQLEALGFSAVPALLEHLDDPRLTCLMMQGFDNVPDCPQSAGHLVSDLLQALSGGELSLDAFDRQRGGRVSKEKALEWWAKAQEIGEEKWLMQGVAAKENRAGSQPNACYLRILKARYPQRLADVLRIQMKESPRVEVRLILDTLLESKLPEEEKSALLKETAATENPANVFWAMQALSRRDRAWFHTEAIGIIDRAGSSETVPDMGTGVELAGFLAMLTDDKEVWAALLRTAKQAEPPRRMRLMSAMDHPWPGNEFKEQRIAFLATFLEDTAVRVLANSKSGVRQAAGSIPRLRVCDFAAMRIASVLGWKDSPDRKWTPKKWENLRSRVKTAVRP